MRPVNSSKLDLARVEESPISAAPTTPLPAADAASAGLLSRRGLLRASTLLCALSVEHVAVAQISRQHQPITAEKGKKNGIVALRIWPAPEYSRVTIESDEELKATYDFAKDDPPRLYVDIQNLLLGPELRTMETRVQADDPNIASIRIAQNSPTIVRMVLDLKQRVRPEVFTLKPIDPYRFRLVFDLYPANAVDPMQQLIAERLQTIAQAPSTEAIHSTPSTAVPTTPPAPPAPVPPPPPLPPKGPDPLDGWFDQHGTARPGPAPVPVPIPPPPPPARPPAPVPPPPPPSPAPPPPPAASPPASIRQTDRIYIVALDPGHGGEDPGAIGQAKTFEKHVVLAIAQQVRDRLNRSRVNGVPLQAFMTRDRDFFVPLAARVERTRRVQADLFISIHADAAENFSANGASVYALSQRGATSTAARLLAEKENLSDAVGGLNVNTADRHVQSTLADMSISAQIRDSLILGALMRQELGKHTRVRGNKVEQANFAVLRNPDTPSILVETGFISNRSEEQLLRSNQHQAKLADAITAGIVAYFRAHPPQPRVRSV